MAEEKKKTEEKKAPASKGTNINKKASKELGVKIDEKKEGEDKEKKNIKRKASVKDEVEKGKGEEKNKNESAKPAKKKNKNIRGQVQKGKTFIKSSYNNTTITFTDLHGNVLAWSSAGLLGFKGAKKATTYAAAQVVGDAHNKVQKYGLRDVEAFIKGVGSGRDSALRALVQKGYNLTSIKDITPLPHNGCRPRKPRRV